MERERAKDRKRERETGEPVKAWEGQEMKKLDGDGERMSLGDFCSRCEVCLISAAGALCSQKLFGIMVCSYQLLDNVTVCAVLQLFVRGQRVGCSGQVVLGVEELPFSDPHVARSLERIVTRPILLGSVGSWGIRQGGEAGW